MQEKNPFKEDAILSLPSSLYAQNKSSKIFLCTEYGVEMICWLIKLSAGRRCTRHSQLTDVLLYLFG